MFSADDLGDVLVLISGDEVGVGLDRRVPPYRRRFARTEIEFRGPSLILLIAEAVARRGASVKQQLAALFEKVGPCASVRINLHLEPAIQTRLLEKLKRDWDKFDSRKVVKIDRTDGLKMIRDDGSWVLMRPSGTEPVVRVYCEASSPDEVERLTTSARAFVFEP